MTTMKQTLITDHFGTTTKQKLQNVHKEMRDLIQKSKDARWTCCVGDWVPIKESKHSDSFWNGIMNNNIQWTETGYTHASTCEFWGIQESIPIGDYSIFWLWLCGEDAVTPEEDKNPECWFGTSDWWDMAQDEHWELKGNPNPPFKIY